jgi:PadR family transcriptional regulator, regulatory protein PadR
MHTEPANLVEDASALPSLDSEGKVAHLPVDSYCRERQEIPPSGNAPPVTARTQTDALRGSLDLLVLKTLSLEPMHGWGISQRVQQLSEGALEVNQGSLYPALQRLEKEGMIASDWRTTENNRRARYYELTPAGRRALGAEVESWRRFAAALELVLDTP